VKQCRHKSVTQLLNVDVNCPMRQLLLLLLMILLANTPSLAPANATVTFSVVQTECTKCSQQPAVNIQVSCVSVVVAIVRIIPARIGDVAYRIALAVSTSMHLAVSS